MIVECRQTQNLHAKLKSRQTQDKDSIDTVGQELHHQVPNQAPTEQWQMCVASWRQ